MNRTTTILLVIVLLLVASLTALAEDPCQRGKDALAKGDIQEAIKNLREGVRKDKKNKECFMNLGKALLQISTADSSDSAQQAVAALVQARELDSTDSNVYLLIGEAYQRQGILPAAVTQWEAATVFDTNNAEIYKRLARAYAKIRDYNKAATNYIRACALDTTDLSCYRELGLLYTRAKSFDKALPYLKFVYDRDPKDTSRVAFARGLSETKRYKEMIPVAEAIIAADSSRTDVLRMLGPAYRSVGDAEKANKVFQIITARGGAMSCKDKLEQAKNLKQLGQVDDAIDAYEEALSCSQDSLGPDIYYDLGALYMNAKNYEKAVANFENMIRVDTTGRTAFASHLNAAISLMQLKQWDGAREHVLKSIEARPDYITSWRTLAQVYGQMDSTAAARRAYKQLVSMIDTSQNQEKYKDAAAEGYRMEGFYLLLEKRYPAAVENLLKSLQYNPTSCQTLLWTAQAYALSNKRDDAKRYYHKVVSNCGKGPGEAKLVEDAKKGLGAMGEDIK